MGQNNVRCNESQETEEILARSRAKFHALVDFLGGFVHEEGRGFCSTCPACNRDKRTFGQSSGAAIYFKPPSIKHPEDCEWVIGEGIETTLSAMLLFQDRGSRLAGIAALSAVGVQYLQLPRCIKRVIIAADNDDNKDGIGERVAKALRYRLWSQGKIVSIAVPPKPGQDWNDVLVAGSDVAR